MDAASAIAVQTAQTRADFSTSQIKQNAEADQQVADLLESAAASIPTSPIKGVNVNVKV